MIEIRREWPEDINGISSVLEKAFGQPNEAKLVNALREHGKHVLSLVALKDGEIVGYILFTRVTVDSKAGNYEILGLAPVGVLPVYQRQGIGIALTNKALEILKAEGHKAVIVLGHPEYYPRFGFIPASRFGIRWELECPDGAFMALELVEGALTGKGGVARFELEFDGV